MEARIGDGDHMSPTVPMTASKNNPQLAVPLVPRGVNLGGWLCLEDWFFSGVEGTAVSTGDDMPHGQGACLPPGATRLSKRWPSEGYLAKALNDSKGPEETVNTFMAHRRSFVGNRDLEMIRASGIQRVRVPLTWAAFADALAPVDAEAYGTHDPEGDASVVPDPFYQKDVAQVTVPRQWLENFLVRAAENELSVLLDLHAFPGGSSQGTYNGVWPNPPKFWQENVTLGNKSVPLKHTGQLVVQALIDWASGLSGDALRAVGGLTLMNEPAHQSSGTDWCSEDQVLSWLAEAAERFRQSPLPKKGVRLYVNIIETAFQDFFGTVVPWWSQTFTEEEQLTWAVMDRHWYTAWSGKACSGRTVPGGGYYCDQPLGKVREVLRSCAGQWAADFEAHFKGLRAVTEFSLGTYDQALFACTDPAVTQAFLEEQVRAFDQHRIDAFFWTWRMPYGRAFEPGWSLKHILGLERKDWLPCSHGSPNSGLPNSGLSNSEL